MACFPGVQLLKQPPTPRSWPWPTNSWRAALPGTRASWRRAANSATASRTRTRCCCATAATRRSICTVLSQSWRVYRMETGTAGNVSIKQQVILVHSYFCQVSWWRYRVRRPFKPDHNYVHFKLFTVVVFRHLRQRGRKCIKISMNQHNSKSKCKRGVVKAWCVD